MWWITASIVTWVAASAIIWEHTDWKVWLLVGTLLSLSHQFEKLHRERAALAREQE